MQNTVVLGRLQNLIGYIPSQSELVSKTGIKQTTLSNKALRNSKWKIEEIQKLNESYGINILQPISQNITDSKECIEIEHIHINPSCGAGTVVIDEPEITPIKLGTKMLEQVLRVSNPYNLKTFTASGDSMEATIDDGNLLLVDLGKTDFNNGGIFVLTINNEWFVKRLRKKLNGDLDVISDNAEKYPIETYHPADNIEIVIKGRVIKNLSKGL